MYDLVAVFMVAATGIISGLMGMFAWLYVPYLIVTWADRERERAAFRLGILRFGLQNGLDDHAIAEAVCKETRREKKQVARVRRNLADGRSLIDALTLYPRTLAGSIWTLYNYSFLSPLKYLSDRSSRVFSPDVSALLRAGERMGRPDTMAACAEDCVELDRTLFTRLNMQMYYPMFLIFGPAYIQTVIVIFIYPQFYEMFDELGVWDEVVQISPGLFLLFAWTLLGVCLAGYLIFRARLSARKRLLSFVRVLSLALDMDLDEATALDLAGSATGSGIMMRRSRGAQRRLRDGLAIDEAVAKSFPRAGEITWFFRQSSLPDAAEAFRTWAGLLRDRLERRAELFAQAFSTLIVLCVGACVCLIAYMLFYYLIALANLLM